MQPWWDYESVGLTPCTPNRGVISCTGVSPERGTSALATQDYRGFTRGDGGMPTSTGSFTGDNEITFANPVELPMRDYILGEEGVFIDATISSLGDFVGDDRGMFAKTGLFFGAGLSDSARAVRAMRCQEDADRVDLARRMREDAEWVNLTRGVREDVAGVDPARRVAEDVAGVDPARRVSEDVAGVDPARWVPEDVAGVDPARRVPEDVAGVDPARRVSGDVGYVDLAGGVQDGAETVSSAYALGADADLLLGATLAGGASHTFWTGFFSG